MHQAKSKKTLNYFLTLPILGCLASCGIKQEVFLPEKKSTSSKFVDSSHNSLLSSKLLVSNNNASICLSKWHDVPLPLELEASSEKIAVHESTDKIGCAFSSDIKTLSYDECKLFYSTELEREGWAAVTQLELSHELLNESVMVYEKRSKLLIINIVAGADAALQNFKDKNAGCKITVYASLKNSTGHGDHI